MIFKKGKLVYMTACANILVATWNTSDLHRENNIEMYDVNAPMDQYIPPAPEYLELQQYENVVYNHNLYNNTMIPGTSNTEALMYQYNSFAPEYSESRQYENELWGYGPYNDNLMEWEFHNVGVPTGSGPVERIGYEEVRNPSIEELVEEFRQAEHNLTLGMEQSVDEHTRRIDELIRESDIAELGTFVGQPVTEHRQTEQNLNLETQQPVDEHTRGIDELSGNSDIAESNTSVEQLIVELRQAEQNMSLGVKLSVEEYDKRIEEVIKKHETIELGTLVDDLEEMPIFEPIKEYESYDMSEQSHSSVISQSTEGSPYDYSNSTFLNMLLHSPVSFITAESIRMRFSGQFLSFLSSDQVIRVLIVLLENKLELLDEAQKEFIEMIFGHIDYSLELVITKDQVVMLVEAMMRSSVSECFEQVFLTWKMWYSFTVEEQEKMLKDVKMKYKREILVMLYLFVVNRDDDNSWQCEIFKNNIKSQYKETGTSNKGYLLEDIVIDAGKWQNGATYAIIDTFDTCLLDIPDVFKDLNKYDADTFWIFFKKNLFCTHHSSKSEVLMYKSHVCYALTKFTRKIGQINSSAQSNGVETNNRLYFDLQNIKFEFKTWIKTLRHDDNKLDDAVFVKDYRKEFVNAFAIIRQMTQSNNYNCNTFLELFDKVNTTDCANKPYLTLLFSLTSENILKEVEKTQKWAEYIRKRSTASHSYQYIENVFMNNANNSLILLSNRTICSHITKFYEYFSKLNIKKNATMHREYYFYQRLLFHPRSIMFNDTFMLSYIKGLSKIGRLNSKEQRDQIARDLIFSGYYHEAVVELKDNSVKFKKEPRLVEFKNSIEKEYNSYKNKEAIETERLMFKKC